MNWKREKMKSGFSATIFAAVLLTFGCATGRHTTVSPPEPLTGSAIGDRGDVGTPDKALSTALSRAVKDPSRWGSLHLLVACNEDVGMRSAEVYGSGVGIWESRRQFTLSSDKISELLQALDKLDFTNLDDVYGGRNKPISKAPKADTEDTGGAIQVICRVVLSLDGHKKQVAQLGRGEQFEEFKELAKNLLNICEKSSHSGVTASDLSDGLKKISRGDLAPETFHVTLHRKPDDTDLALGSEGFLLRLSGPRVITRGYDDSAQFLDSRALTLSAAEMTQLASELTGLGIDQMPANLYATNYTDLNVGVLHHKKSVQARQFADMTATTHGERQQSFDLLYSTLEQLHTRVMSEGQPITDETLSP